MNRLGPIRFSVIFAVSSVPVIFITATTLHFDAFVPYDLNNLASLLSVPLLFYLAVHINLN